MESIDFRSLSERLRTELSRVYFWQKIVRILSIIVYLFVFCWMMFVLFGGYLVGYCCIFKHEDLYFTVDKSV